MSPNLLAYVDGFADLRVVVIGEAMLDSYLHGSAERLSREAPVPIVSLEHRDDAPGGAGNTAANVCSLGADVRLLSVLGTDDDGHRLRQPDRSEVSERRAGIWRAVLPTR